MELKREFYGMVSGVDTTVITDMSQTAVMVTAPVLNIDLDGSLLFSGVRFTDDIAEAGALVGRRVRVTVEILGEDA